MFEMTEKLRAQTWVQMSANELMRSFLTEEDFLPFFLSPAERIYQICKELATPGRHEKQEDSESRWKQNEGSRDMRQWAIWWIWNSRHHKLTATKLNLITLMHFLFFPHTVAFNFASISEKLSLAVQCSCSALWTENSSISLANHRQAVSAFV